MIRLSLALALLAAMLGAAGLPLLIARQARRRLRLGWDDFANGALTFGIVGLGVLLPLVDRASRWAAARDWTDSTAGLAAWAVVLALLTAAVEQVGRYLGLRLLFTGVHRTWPRAVLFGLGYAALQAIFVVALPVFVRLGNALFVSQINPFAPGMRVSEAMEVLAQQRAITAMTVWRPLLQSAESAVMVGLQTALTVLVLQAFRRARLVWVLHAAGLHATGQASLLLGTAFSQPLLGLVGLAAVTAIAGWWSLRLRPQRKLIMSA